MRIVLSTLLLLVTQGCGAIWGVTNCDFRAESDPPRCQEREGAMGVAFMALCSLTKGEPVEGPCPREDIVAGCRGAVNPAQSVTDWYYRSSGSEPIQTDADVQKQCDEESDDTTLVHP